MKILLIVPDGLCIRNYLFSDFVATLEKNNNQVIIYHNVGNQAVEEIKKVQKNTFAIKKIINFIENPKARILRESIAYARLIINSKKLDNKTIMCFWNKNHIGFKKKALCKLSEILGYIISKSYKLILKAEKKYENEIQKSPIIKTIQDDFEAFKPDFVLNLHQRSPISSLVINVAKSRKIKTATVIFSWDNIPKARLISRYDHYFVWSDLMKTDLNLLYPEINLSQIKVTGTPQFEFYFHENYAQSKTKFFESFGLNPNKKTICFSANDMSSPHEQNYLEDLCQELNKVDEKIRPQILFRNCPVDKSNRFDETLKKYSNFVFAIAPDWKIDEETNIFPTLNDFILLANTVKHCDLVINLGSTMAHDFAVYNKPCLYLNYDPVLNPKYKTKEVYDFQHFKSMNNLQAVGWINSKQEFVPKILEAIKNPENTGKDRHLWMQKIVKYPLQENSINLSNQISLCIFAS